MTLRIAQVNVLSYHFTSPFSSTGTRTALQLYKFTQNKTPLVSLSKQFEHTALLQGADDLVIRVELVRVGVDQLHTARSGEAVDSTVQSAARLSKHLHTSEGRQVADDINPGNVLEGPLHKTHQKHLASLLVQRGLERQGVKAIGTQVAVQRSVQLGVANALHRHRQPSRLPTVAPGTHFHQTGTELLGTHRQAVRAVGHARRVANNLHMRRSLVNLESLNDLTGILNHRSDFRVGGVLQGHSEVHKVGPVDGAFVVLPDRDDLVDTIATHAIDNILGTREILLAEHAVVDRSEVVDLAVGGVESGEAVLQRAAQSDMVGAGALVGLEDQLGSTSGS
mmetsp:Transcript_46221/g.80833  ORF Transcript_46221/g.80833 Transcript_46221/m.80833 type:complete len:337 (-) Transcript_46221:2103-3113(-)